jgi:hypothetical protein
MYHRTPSFSDIYQITKLKEMGRNSEMIYRRKLKPISYKMLKRIERHYNPKTNDSTFFLIKNKSLKTNDSTLIQCLCNPWNKFKFIGVLNENNYFQYVSLLLMIRLLFLKSVLLHKFLSSILFDFKTNYFLNEKTNYFC